MKKDDYGVITHPEDFDDLLHVATDEEAGKIHKNMIRAFIGEEVVLYGERYVDLMTKKLCKTVTCEREATIRATRNGSMNKGVKGNQNASKTSKKQAKNEQKTSKKQAEDEQKTSFNIKYNIKDNIKDNNNSPTGNIKEMCKEKYGEFENVLLTVDEFFKLKDRFPDDYQDRIERLSAYIEQFPDKAKKYKSHYATILSWAQKDARDKKPEKKSTDDMLYDWLNNGGENDKGGVHADSANDESNLYGCEIHTRREIS